jgi:hypothetical protein
MPTAEQILAGLHDIANGWRGLAILWHAYFAVLGVGLVMGARPSRRLSGLLLSLPLLSVSALAWLAGNPFNGTIFALAGIVLLALASRLPRAKIQCAPSWAAIPGLLMFAFGWYYPHFVETSSYATFLYAAPTGLIPCPTLSIVIGFALVTDGLGSRAWSLVLAATGILYGIFGAVGLGVMMDWILVAGAILLLGMVLMATPRPNEVA